MLTELLASGAVDAFETRLEPVDMNAIIETAVDVVDYGIKSAGDAVVLDLAADLPLAKADKDQIAQVLVNVLVNAEQANAEAPDEAQVTLRSWADPESAQVKVSVSDNGPGIAPAVRERIFEPFFTTKKEGAGVGLALCHWILAGHDGTLTAGEADVAEMLSDMLDILGVKSTIAHSAEAAIEALGAETPDALLLDMPGEDCLSILRRLRSTLSLPVIMPTAAGEVIDRVVGLEMGAHDYLAKPVDLRELEARVRAVLRRGAPEVKALDAPAAGERYGFDGLTVDLEGARLFDPEG